MADTTNIPASTIPVTLYLDADTKQRIDSLRATVGVTLNGFIRVAIAEHLKLYPANHDPETIARLVSRS